MKIHDNRFNSAITLNNNNNSNNNNNNNKQDIFFKLLTFDA